MAPSANKKIIKTDKAPQGLKGIYNQAVVANGMVFCSGSVAMDPATNTIVEGDVQAHTVRLPSHPPSFFSSLSLGADVE